MSKRKTCDNYPSGAVQVLVRDHAQRELALLSSPETCPVSSNIQSLIFSQSGLQGAPEPPARIALLLLSFVPLSPLAYVPPSV